MSSFRELPDLVGEFDLNWIAWASDISALGPTADAQELVVRAAAFRLLNEPTVVSFVVGSKGTFESVPEMQAADRRNVEDVVAKITETATAFNHEYCTSAHLFYALMLLDEHVVQQVLKDFSDRRPITEMPLLEDRIAAAEASGSVEKARLYKKFYYVPRFTVESVKSILKDYFESEWFPYDRRAYVKYNASQKDRTASMGFTAHMLALANEGRTI